MFGLLLLLLNIILCCCASVIFIFRSVGCLKNKLPIVFTCIQTSKQEALCKCLLLLLVSFFCYHFFVLSMRLKILHPSASCSLRISSPNLLSCHTFYASMCVDIRREQARHACVYKSIITMLFFFFFQC